MSEQYKELKELAIKLVNRLNEIEADKSYAAVFTCASLREVYYTGNGWSVEKEDLERFLEHEK